nr:hypothetical protein I302_01694 [Kwoniella bestiolae CBS 10118]OCF30175.1 hypothetical protein I302_01694 [Kwoniella bestiolae CBS 10118]
MPFTLDLSCPLNLPSKSLAAGADWPFQIAGASTFSQESIEEFVKRRYYETLYLSETLSPLSGFTADLFKLINTPNPDIGGLLKPLLLCLPQIEHRHRKLILPLLSSTNLSEGISQVEQNVIKFALELRLGSRKALDEGIIPTPKKISDELEKREILMQMILLLLYFTYPPPASPAITSKKRKRSKHLSRSEMDSPTSVNPAEDPKTALDLLMDRLSVWQAVSELGLGLGLSSSDGDVKANGKGKGKAEENSIANMLGRFWKTVMLPYFLPKQPDLCSTFHQKVFGHPLPPRLLPPPISSSTSTSTKKPRKPKLTRPLPNSKDSLIPPPPIPFERPRSISNEGRGISRVSSRAGSRAPSENGSFRESPPPRDTSLGMKRSLSRATTGSESLHNIGGMGMRRSRSRSQSIDPHPHPHPMPGRSDSLSRSISTAALGGHGPTNKKGLVRNQSSGKDLFKGREVGLMRRSMSSKRTDMKDESQIQSQGRFGLLGRKTSGGRERDAMRKGSMEESQPQSQSQPNTLILATPSKPRSYQNPFFRSQSQSQAQPHWIPPTPIQEEQPTPRPNFIAETPVAPSRIARTDVLPLGGIAAGDGSESDDPLGELWELTDDEDEEEEGRGRGGREMIPETPMK